MSDIIAKSFSPKSIPILFPVSSTSSLGTSMPTDIYQCNPSCVTLGLVILLPTGTLLFYYNLTQPIFSSLT